MSFGVFKRCDRTRVPRKTTCAFVKTWWDVTHAGKIFWSALGIYVRKFSISSGHSAFEFNVSYTANVDDDEDTIATSQYTPLSTHCPYPSYPTGLRQLCFSHFRLSLPLLSSLTLSLFVSPALNRQTHRNWDGNIFDTTTRVRPRTTNSVVCARALSNLKIFGLCRIPSIHYLIKCLSNEHRFIRLCDNFYFYVCFVITKSVA